jgi:hypothetical protein
MIKQKLKYSVVLAGLTFATSLGAQTPPPTVEEMWEVIQAQQREIEALKSQLKKTKEQVEETDQKVEATGEMLDEVSAAGIPSSARWAEKSRFGGYGEVHYNNLNSKNEVDFHRFVLYFAHDFTDRIRFYSEVELEHALAGEGEAGEIELEQAYIGFDLLTEQRLTAYAGLILVPVGIINETHEPPTFYGVERNRVETEILPTTWWEAGLAFQGLAFPGFSYNLFVTSGLNVPTSGDNPFRIRSGRQKVSEAVANDGAFGAQIKWTGLPGVEVGVFGEYQTDITQGEGGPQVGDIGATLFEAHTILSKGPFGFRALYARWDLDDGGLLGPKNNPDQPGHNEQWGWYVEPAFRFAPGLLPGQIGLFARYSELDTQAGVSDAIKGGSTTKQEFTTGFNYWPISNVVFKFDYQDQMGDQDDDGFNLGLGYAFF